MARLAFSHLNMNTSFSKVQTISTHAMRHKLQMHLYKDLPTRSTYKTGAKSVTMKFNLCIGFFAVLLILSVILLSSIKEISEPEWRMDPLRKFETCAIYTSHSQSNDTTGTTDITATTTTTAPIPQKNSLEKMLLEFQWDKLYKSFVEYNQTALDNHIETLIQAMLPFLIMEPGPPISTSCVPTQPSKSGANWVDCQRRTKDRKVAVLVQFGFDVDTLEIHMNELFDIVDQFFIIESTRTHFRAVTKPLIWDRIKSQPRFSKFKSKVTHFVLDDGDTVEIRQRIVNSEKIYVDWGVERLQERLRWEMFLKWNNATATFEDDDLIGFGDTDEIPSRDTVLSLKQCEIRTDPVDIGIWFPFGNVETAWRANSVPGNPYALGDPTYWKLGTAKAYTNSTHYPSRMRGSSPAFRLGGMHMTHYGYLPLQIVKRLTLTESDNDFYQQTVMLVNSLKVKASNLRNLELKFAEVYDQFKDRLIKIEDLKARNGSNIDKIAVFPWFYKCNRERYPMWEGGHDDRLDKHF